MVDQVDVRVLRDVGLRESIRAYICLIKDEMDCVTEVIDLVVELILELFVKLVWEAKEGQLGRVAVFEGSGGAFHRIIIIRSNQSASLNYP